MGTTDSRARDNIVCSEDKKDVLIFSNGLDTHEPVLSITQLEDDTFPELHIPLININQKIRDLLTKRPDLRRLTEANGFRQPRIKAETSKDYVLFRAETGPYSTHRSKV